MRQRGGVEPLSYQRGGGNGSKRSSYYPRDIIRSPLMYNNAAPVHLL